MLLHAFIAAIDGIRVAVADSLMSLPLDGQKLTQAEYDASSGRWMSLTPIC